ncbi:hypothetical protein IG193_02145 [Infirmifilum lucidum]|uniref:Uncharacterized protein n=1 Tax=Infirmifilum lucidum TaxID=2776706 RepID=A0A7L9FK85_9CREN|nr:hypothetical protein [Infirmifilum lucidum]QOJ79286.1 hypothetical protein IG193_02145 [Infirmifilum lucidum]
MTRVSAYQGFGVSLVVAGSILATATYLFMGFTPLVALWFGLAVVGASMALTPQRITLSRELLGLVESSLVNMAVALEFFRVGSYNAYASYGGDVYVFVSKKPLSSLPRERPEFFVRVEGDNVLVALRSPVSGLIPGAGDFCSLVEEVAVDRLGLAEWVRCVERGEGALVEFRGVKTSSPYRLSTSAGSVYGIIAGSVMAVVRGSATVVSDTLEGDLRRVVVRGGVGGEGLPG